jgi:CMP-N-acetylneuraminic acid synthetase/mannose-6-phosphate isomerase-like protein (cupin superfamily)
VKIIAMIPARLGSKRVPKKNLRLLNGKPLISYAIEAARSSGVFSEIYINSEADIFEEIAAEYNVKFYKRPGPLSDDTAINDEFAFDFIKKVNGDILVQFLPTSPLITPGEVKGFVSEMLEKKYDALVSVEGHQIACLYEGKPINFSLTESHRSSQGMTPVNSYATVLMAWTYKSFTDNMNKHGCAYHGGAGNTGYYTLKGLSTIDIDNENDFELAEVALEYRNNKCRGSKKYYQSTKYREEISETDVPSILKKDGVSQADFKHENLPVVDLGEIISGQDNKKSWCYRIINTENNSATLISQLQGEGNRLHYHPDWNEWWYIVEGEAKWEIEGKELLVKKGNIVFMEKKKLHRISTIGNKPCVRLAVSRDLVPHIYPKI